MRAIFTEIIVTMLNLTQWYMEQKHTHKAEFILDRKRFFFYRFVACAFPFFFLGQERLTDRSISKRYLKSDIAT